MDDCRHHVSGFFARRTEAEGARSRLAERGWPLARRRLFDADSGPAITEPTGQSNELLINVLIDGAVGTTVGEFKDMAGQVSV